MPRFAILNMTIGFGVIFIAACAGSFIAFDMTEGFMRDPEILQTWQLALLKSSHGHSNLFGMIHILFGLTYPYSPLSEKAKRLQTLGFLLGTLAMGPGMMARAYGGPSDSLDLIGSMIGMGLSATFLALLAHFGALSYRLFSRQ